MSLGLLVYGDNHLILRGPQPSGEEARALAGHFGLSRAQITSAVDRSGRFSDWCISVREFREDLQWATVLPASTERSAAIEQLLAELAGRGLEIDVFKEISCAV